MVSILSWSCVIMSADRMFRSPERDEGKQKVILARNSPTDFTHRWNPL